MPLCRLSILNCFPSWRAGAAIVFVTGLVSICSGPFATAGEPSPPRFVVPEHAHEMQLLNDLLALHLEGAFSDCTLWDGWLPHATLWTGPTPRARYRKSFLNRRIDADHYVSMQQHRGMAHSEGWPFPAWQQSTGIGWHFSVAHEPWARQNFGLQALTSADGWQIDGAEIEAFDPAVGMRLRATEDIIEITTPEFQCGTIVAPFIRVEWAAEELSPQSRPHVSWRLSDENDWQADRFAAFPPRRTIEMHYDNVPLFEQPDYLGMLKQIRLKFDYAAGARLTLKSVITAIDTRHPITNSNYIRGSGEYFFWTHDVAFLKEAMPRLRQALRYALDEFQVHQQNHIVVPWVGHGGRSGLSFSEDGKKTLLPGIGVGNNYWDLLPFGGHDALATIYLYDALTSMAKLEQAVARHPEWQIPVETEPFPAEELRELATHVRKDFQKRFWNDETGRFVGWIDRDGRSYDYGFTFVNLEAIAYGLVSEEQSRRIFTWLDGERTVSADTSTGEDIYHWRFAPRATTRRNVETYVWVWSAPESIPWGGQVQDGGAVLGFSYFDLMARLRVKGPDDAWQRLRDILNWFEEVQQAGGYRKYYAQPGRGTLQGGGTAGGLGLDHEFLESVLVPQVMLYGFLGFEPSADSFEVHPRLPSDWDRLTVNGVHLHDRVMNITAHADGRVSVVDVGSKTEAP